MEGQRAASRSTQTEKKRILSRIDLAVPLFIFAGIGAAYLSAMGATALGFSPPGDLSALIKAAPMMLFFPSFLVALVRRRWASVPLWSCCLWLAVYTSLHQNSLIFSGVKEWLQIVWIPALTELGRFVRGNAPEIRT